MAITAEVRKDILELLVLMFDAAPGATYLSDITALYDSISGTHAQKMQGLAFTLSNTGVFQAEHPNFQTANEFATDFLSTLELENNAEARAWVIANFGNGSPATKAQIMYAGWNFLNSYAGTDPDFLNAQAIMNNKATVSEYYSVTLGEAALDLATLQDVLADVDATQESVDAAIEEIEDEAAELQVLTPENDIIEVLNNDVVTIEGIVDGDTDGAGGDGRENATFNPGDNITGNGSTELNLVVVDGGEAGFMRLTEIEAVNIEAGTDEFVWFNAAGWTGVGEVILGSGVDGMGVSLDNLEAGTVITVTDITGSIMADYDTDLGNAFLWLYNGNEGGEGITGVATIEGDITVEGSDSVSVTIYDSNGVSLDDISVTVADNSYFTLEFDDEGYTVGDVNVMMGDEGFFGVGVFNDSDLTGDQTYGNITATVGAESTVDIEFNDGEDGNITVGNIDVEMGATGDFELNVMSNTAFEEDTVDIVFGDVSVVAGDESELDIFVYNNDDGDITFGDIAMEAGLAGSINVTFDGYGEDGAGQMLTVGNVSLTVGDSTTGTAGEDGYANLNVESFSGADFGDVSLVGGTGSTVDVSFSYISGDLDIGNVNLEAGDWAEMGIFEATGDVTVGNVDITSGGVAWAWISKSGSGEGDDEVGAVTVGDVNMSAGSAYAWFTIQDYNQITVGDATLTAATEAEFYVEAEGNLSDITVGDVAASVTADGGWAMIYLDNTVSAPNAGSVMAGDLSVAANGDDGEVAIYVYQSNTAATTESNTGTAVGDVTVGNITASVGSEVDVGEDADYDVSISIWNSGWGGAGQMAGSVMVGDVDITMGDGFVSGTLTNDAAAWLYVANWGTAGMGDLTVGNVDVVGGDFMAATLSFSGYADEAGSEVGNMTIGNITVDGGESSWVDIGALWEIHDSAGTLGDLSVGDITANVAQDSTVVISVDHSITENADADMVSSIGDTTVGNIDVTMGDNAEVFVYVDSWVNFWSEEDSVDGDFTVGDISIAVSATETEDLSGGSNIGVFINSTAWNNDAGEGEGGNFTVGDVTLSAAGDLADIDVTITNQGSWDVMGDTDIGMIALTAANTADLDVTVLVANYTTGEVGNVTLGGFSLTAGDDSTANVDVDIDASYTGDAGNIDLGDMTVDIGDSSTATISVSIDHYTGDSQGDFRIGNVSVTAGETSVVTMTAVDVEVEDGGDIGDVEIGSVTVNLDASAELYYSPSVDATDGTVGNVSVGSIDATLGENAILSISIEVSGDLGVGDITVGDVMLDAAEGAEVSYLIVSVTSEAGSLGEVMVGNIDLDFEAGATMSDSGYLWFSALNDIGGVTVGDVSIEASDGAIVNYTIYAEAQTGQAGDMVVGDINLFALDEGVEVQVPNTETPTATYEVGSAITLYISNWGETGDSLTVGDVTIDVEGSNTDTTEGPADAVQLYLSSAGDIIIGDVTVSGAGLFILDGADHAATDGASFIAVDAGGEITIGDIDFSGYENDITLDLSWTDAGADNISAGEGNDVVYDNEGDNVISGGEGVDLLDITEGGDDTIVTSEGDSGVTDATTDTITGFDAVNDDDSLGDRLDFNHVAGTAGNYVEDSDGVGSYAQFITDAASALNSTVRYYAAYNAGSNETWVAVNYGSGEADLVVALTGNHISEMTFENFIA